MFQNISLLIALLALLKAITGLLMSERFYGWRQQPSPFSFFELEGKDP